LLFIKGHNSVRTIQDSHMIKFQSNIYILCEEKFVKTDFCNSSMKGASEAGWWEHRSHTTSISPSFNVDLNFAQTYPSVWKRLSVYLWKFGGLPRIHCIMFPSSLFHQQKLMPQYHTFTQCREVLKTKTFITGHKLVQNT
jgi:hypothetical protein